MQDEKAAERGLSAGHAPFKARFKPSVPLHCRKRLPRKQEPKLYRKSISRANCACARKNEAGSRSFPGGSQSFCGTETLFSLADAYFRSVKNMKRCDRLSFRSHYTTKRHRAHSDCGYEKGLCMIMCARIETRETATQGHMQTGIRENTKRQRRF